MVKLEFMGATDIANVMNEFLKPSDSQDSVLPPLKRTESLSWTCCLSKGTGCYKGPHRLPGVTSEPYQT